MVSPQAPQLAAPATTSTAPSKGIGLIGWPGVWAARCTSTISTVPATAARLAAKRIRRRSTLSWRRDVYPGGGVRGIGALAIQSWGSLIAEGSLGSAGGSAAGFIRWGHQQAAPPSRHWWGTKKPQAVSSAHRTTAPQTG